MGTKKISTQTKKTNVGAKKTNTSVKKVNTTPKKDLGVSGNDTAPIKKTNATTRTQKPKKIIKKINKVSVLHKFSDEKNIDIVRYKAMKIVFIFAIFLFFINFYLLGANFYYDYLIVTFPFTYIFLLVSLLFYFFFLLKNNIKNNIVLYILIIILFIFFILLLLPFSFRGGYQNLADIFRSSLF